MREKPHTLDYATRSLPARSPIPAAGVLVGVQAAWFIPGALWAWVWLCDHRMINDAVPNAIFAAIVCAPSILAMLYGVRLLRRYREESVARLIITAISIVLAVGFVAYVCVAMIHELRHPSRDQCG